MTETKTPTLHLLESWWDIASVAPIGIAMLVIHQSGVSGIIAIPIAFLLTQAIASPNPLKPIWGLGESFRQLRVLVTSIPRALCVAVPVAIAAIVAGLQNRPLELVFTYIAAGILLLLLSSAFAKFGSGKESLEAEQVRAGLVLLFNRFAFDLDILNASTIEADESSSVITPTPPLVWERFSSDAQLLHEAAARRNMSITEFTAAQMVIVTTPSKPKPVQVPEYKAPQKAQTETKFTVQEGALFG